MKFVTFPSIGEGYFEEVLPNGLRVCVVPKKGFAKKYGFLAVDFGAIDTKFTKDGKSYRVPDGIAHYLEHKMFDLPEGSADGRFAALGASPNAFTSYDITAYHFSCVENFEENLRLLLRMVLTPYFTEESVEKERGIIAQEIRMYEDSGETRAYENLFSALYRSHPISVPVAGTVESIGEITAQTLYDCYRAFYRPQNMMLCVVGDVDETVVSQIAAEAAPLSEGGLPVRDYGGKETMEPAQNRIVRNMEVSMPTFCLGFKCEAPAGSPMQQEMIGDLAMELLIGESSPLYRRLYEENLIDTGFSAGYESVKGAWLLSAGGDSRNPEAVCAALLEEAKRLAKEGFDGALFERLKKSSLGRRMRDLDSFESICYRKCAGFFQGEDYFDFSKLYESITPPVVQEFLTRTVCSERAALSVVLPKE